ncbi:MAG: M61 family metallopeptidase [Bernardetiaceae bacterium]|nr:M61 family metallopeptidase [Bernardetiaceae bacterium]
MTTKKLCFLLAFLLLCIQSIFAQNIHYKVSFPEPHTHYVEVRVEVSGWKGEEAQMAMPTWAPGSYLIREFSRHVESVSAETLKEKQPLKVEKTTKNNWKIKTKAQDFAFSYRVYAFELTVRTSFVDASHAYLNGTSVFMFLRNHLDKAVTIEIEKRKEWAHISNGLEIIDNDPYKRKAPNYDVFVDAPFEIGNQEIFEFEAVGIPHKVAMYGGGNYDKDRLTQDMIKVIEACTDIFGENPCKDYTFIVHNLESGGGGLEHLNSTTLQASRYSYDFNHKGFMGLVAHEYFHLWNGKRIRPVPLGPFDYENEAYTRQLWVVEGITAYYDELLLVRSGINDANSYLYALSQSIQGFENRPGRKVQSVAEASLDAWIKFYRPNENSANTTVSYYGTGSIYAALLDLEIIHQTNGEKSLDDLMRVMYQKYAKTLDRGYTEEEFKKEAETVAGIELDDFFENYIYGTSPVDYNKYFDYAGLKLEVKEVKSIRIGASLYEQDAGLLVRNISRETPAHRDGLNYGDLITEIDEKPITSLRELTAMLNKKQENDVLNIKLLRDGIAYEIKLTLTPVITKTFKPAMQDDINEKQIKVLKKWLGEF